MRTEVRFQSNARAACSMVILVCIVFSCRASAVEHIPTENFAALPDVVGVKLSPSGRRLVAVANLVREDFVGRVVLTRDLVTGQQSIATSLPDGEYKYNWIRWANDRQLLVSVRTRGSLGGTAFTMTRLLIVDADTGETKRAFSRRLVSRANWTPQFQDRVVDMLPDDPEHILMEADFEVAGSTGVFRVNLNSGTMKRIVRYRLDVSNWLTDRQGRIRIGIYQDRTSFRVYEQDVKGKNWRVLWEYEALSDDVVTPLGFGADPSKLYINAYHEGRRSVFRVDLSDPDLDRELIFSDPNFDVSGSLVYSPKSKDVVGIRTGIDGAYEFWSNEHKALLHTVDNGLPDAFNQIISLSQDEQLLVFLSQNDRNAGTYYVLDREKRMTSVAQRYSKLPPELMAEKKSIDYEARDGESIHAYLTLPLDTEPENLPTIIMPHGGPISYDTAAFDYWTQLFANRGYAVLQMNFRGSGGYGYDFMAAGLQNWGLKMQDDVTDGTQWLIDNGIADATKICIVGGSYGGYAALMGAAKTPDMYQCAVSFAGVTDLAALLSSKQRYRNAEITELQLGSKKSDLKARSPINMADDIQVPVLLVHGEKDVVVRVRQSRNMHKALARLDKDVTYIEQPGGDHHLSTNEQRLEALMAIERFLDEYLH